MIAFVDYFRCCRVKHCTFEKPSLNVEYLNTTLNENVRYVQKKTCGDAVEVLRKKYPHAIDDSMKHLDKSENDKWQVKQFRKLKKFRPCVDEFGLIFTERRLEKSPKLCFDSKHTLVLPSRHPLTRQVVALRCLTHFVVNQRKFWVINGNAAVKARLLCLQY